MKKIKIYQEQAGRPRIETFNGFSEKVFNLAVMINNWR